MDDDDSLDDDDDRENRSPHINQEDCEDEQSKSMTGELLLVMWYFDIVTCMRQQIFLVVELSVSSTRQWCFQDGGITSSTWFG